MKIDGTNISMIRGDSESITIKCKNDLGEDVAFVTGDRLYFTVKDNARETTKRLQKLITNFAAGMGTFEILPEDTKSLDFTSYVYDIQLTRLDGTVSTIIPVSKFKICQEVTYE